MRRGRLKYGNTRIEFEDIKFDSKIELARYRYLRGLELRGEITGLLVHPRYLLELGDGRKVLIRSATRSTVARYTPDFEYIVAKDGRRVVEDVKSPYLAKDGHFKLRRAVFEMIYGVEVAIVLKAESPIPSGYVSGKRSKT